MPDRRTISLTLTGVGGVRLAVQARVPEWSRALLLVIHGLGDHAGRYDEFAAATSRHGIATFALDLRGHGLSSGQRGHTSSFGHFLADVALVREQVQRLHPGLPFFMLGQSMGGLVLLRYLQQREPVAGAIICSPWLATAMPVPAWKRALAPVSAVLLPRLPFAHGIAAEDLSRDPRTADAYRADPLVHGRITPATFRAATAAMSEAQAQRDRLIMPLLFLAGGADRVVDTLVTERFALSLRSSDVTLHIMPDHYHELLHEIDREATFLLIARWLLDRI